MDTADREELQLPGGPESREEGSTHGHSQRDVDRRGSVTQIFDAALVGGHVKNTLVHTGHCRPTHALLNAPARVNSGTVCVVELWKEEDREG